MSVKYIVMSGAQNTMLMVAKKGVLGLNRNTMRYQRFAKHANFEVVKDPDVESGYLLLSDIDIVKEAINLGLLFMQGIRTQSRTFKI